MPWIILLLPWLELWTLIELGASTSALTALAWVFATLLLGLSMIRRQGLQVLQQMQRDADTGFFSPQLLSDDLAMICSGMLLMVPGLITDSLALLVLIGPLRRKLLGLGKWQVQSGTASYRQRSPESPQSGDEPTTLEGDFRRLDD
ncbi:MAG: FxsA family protein [Halieaceae bacterium]